jgi:DNA-binding transcriptional ArsR family regulator
MGITKSEEFSVKDNRVARYAKALSHPARIAILKLLVKKQACICGDIVDELPLSQSTVSQHLKELKDAGLIKGDIDGAKVCYCIDDEEWQRAKQSLNELFSSYEAAAAKCC